METISPEWIMETVAKGKPFTLLLLITGQTAPREEQLMNQLQMEHLQHLFTLKQEGRSSVFGPVTHERIRGIIIFNTTNKEAIAEWMADDPFIKGGYLTYELYDFFTIPGQQIINY
ncbi:MAG TPA: YciI family protein [Flavisolibacter sp.]|jgi:uncharacterized protein YciI|nr:YciI family protein [Flavisolibacter sp.]